MDKGKNEFLGQKIFFLVELKKYTKLGQAN
jgi:hypothetical protein